MDKREHTLDHDSNNHEVKQSAEKEKYPNCERVSASNYTNRDDRASSILTSSRSYSNGNASSTVVFDGDSKEGDIYKPSSQGVASKEDFYAKNDVIRDRKPMTESSCSNSTQIVRPVASSNDSYQDISTEAKSSEHHTGGSSISFPIDLRCRAEEPVTSREVSCMDAQITQKVVCDIRCRDNLKVLGTTKNQPNGGSHGEESSESDMTIAEDVASTKAYGFDLNEDIHGSNFSCHNQIGSCCSVIHVVAKSGVPLSIPISPLKREGSQGWKGSAATSAFRPTLSKISDRTASNNNHTSEHSNEFFGFDLNVSSEEDNAYNKLHGAQTGSASLNKNYPLKVNSGRAERLHFDLNCLSDTTDECARTSKTTMEDFNLNEDPSLDTKVNVYRQFRSSQPTEKMTIVSSANSFPENARDHDFSFARPVYWTDVSPVQFFGHSQARPLLMAAPNVLQPVEQPKLPYMMQTLSSQSYPSSGPFFIDTSESLSPGIHYPGSAVPYSRDPRVHTVFPQIMNHGMLPSFPGTTPHLMQVVHVQSPSEFTNSNVANGDTLAVNGNTRDYTRQFLPPAKSSTPDEQVKPYHPAALGPNQPMKRGEPDGGWNSFQIGNRQFASWN